MFTLLLKILIAPMLPNSPALPQQARPTAIVRVSVKVFRDDYHDRSDKLAYRDEEEIHDAIRGANNILARSEADWRLELIETVVISDGLGGIVVPCEKKAALEKSAEADPDGFAWRSDAINIYLMPLDDCEGVSSSPAGFGHLNDIVLVSNRSSADAGVVWLHEIGHYFGLHHTFEDYTPKPDIDACSEGGGIGVAGFPIRCSDVCPDTTNVMSYEESMTAENGRLSPCQLEIVNQHLATSRRHVVKTIES